MDKQTLLTGSRLPEAVVTLPKVGDVRVRGLSRAEVLALRQDPGDKDAERRYVAAAMVDPALTEDEVGQWQAIATGEEFQAVVEAIYDLSGFGREAEKSAYKRVS
ncbi:hypothetical protein ALI144C_44825 [Actinosynnema sp. ALI-1.44]|uniref:hypothetical protein n=1 Tax=Actinosynnema sp. ALI-1.44 TaxID=1933779 RepID=UPI00097BEDEA|nr:hypothetical protein [Actinosynnema sp. ALI-1.44]ONI73078.1 hypothetical protein ALI144C_44825 [Actinosynnema sp. ALI-1.44]